MYSDSISRTKGDAMIINMEEANTELHIEWFGLSYVVSVWTRADGSKILEMYPE
jgi:hypothetical protein